MRNSVRLQGYIRKDIKHLSLSTLAVLAIVGCSDEGAAVRVTDPGDTQTLTPQDQTQPGPQEVESQAEIETIMMPDSQPEPESVAQPDTQPAPQPVAQPVPQPTGPTPPEFLTGQTFNLGGIGPSGGIVFFLTGGGNIGNSGLEVPQTDAAIQGQQERFGWGCDDGNEFVAPVDLASVENLLDTSNLDDNPGSFNTAQIISNNCVPSNGGISAAQAAADFVWPDGSTGGYLPNRDELGELRAFVLSNAGGVLSGSLLPDRYWSSSEVDARFAWTIRFDVNTDDEDATISNKFNFQNVRAVRSF